jgi:hypothetical protein
VGEASRKGFFVEGISAALLLALYSAKQPFQPFGIIAICCRNKIAGFTIVTIIFVPLSFVMSLFALPIDRFQQNQIDSPWSSGTKMYSTNYIGKWAGKYLHSAQYASINL